MNLESEQNVVMLDEILRSCLFIVFKTFWGFVETKNTNSFVFSVCSFMLVMVLLLGNRILKFGTPYFTSCTPRFHPSGDDDSYDEYAYVPFPLVFTFSVPLTNKKHTFAFIVGIITAMLKKILKYCKIFI